MNDVARLFGARAQTYADFRPHYPPELFDWLAKHSPDRQSALDIACGNGQASLPLLTHFKQVLACDASLEQLRETPDVQGLERFVATAETLPLADANLDLIVVAQALHWFSTPSFYEEAQRLLKPGGLFCAWCYGLMRIDPELDPLIEHFYASTLANYWLNGRTSVDAGYRDLQPPFARVSVPPFNLETQWSLAHLLGYLRTWSAVQRWEQTNGRDPVTEIEPSIKHAWGDPDSLKTIRWPLHFLAGYPAGPA